MIDKGRACGLYGVFMPRLNNEQQETLFRPVSGYKHIRSAKENVFLRPQAMNKNARLQNIKGV